jgi:hypothetical protein
MTHLGNNLKPAANPYPKGFMIKDPTSSTMEERMPMVNQGPTSPAEWQFLCERRCK